MLLKSLINKGVEALSPMYSQSEARQIIMTYFQTCLGVDRLTLILYPDYEVSGDLVQKVLSDFARLEEGEPLQYVVGSAHFYGRNFHVTPDTLIPRQETELLCREIISLCSTEKSPRILDLCTGSGCIAWTLALEIPGAKVTAVDISEEALKVASTQDFTEEMLKSGASSPQFLKADILQGPGQFNEPFDIIVSNPPYVRESEKSMMHANVLEHEPHLALFVSDEDPLIFYRSVAHWATELLAKGGVVIVEINEAFGKETSEVFPCSDFTNISILKDLSEKDRFICAKRLCK